MARRKPKTLEENEFNRVVGARICRLRKRRGFTQAGLACWAGVTGAQLGYYETGSQRVPPFRLQKIARRLGVGVDELLPNPR